MYHLHLRHSTEARVTRLLNLAPFDISKLVELALSPLLDLPDLPEARFMAFAENYEYIQRENAKGHSYKLGLNEFSDMSMDEFKVSKLGMMPGSIWGNVPSGGVHKVSNASLPKSVDWRSKAVTAVKNQKQCGSCAMP